MRGGIIPVAFENKVFNTNLVKQNFNHIGQFFAEIAVMTLLGEIAHHRQ
jgi:hypothetical protein